MKYLQGFVSVICALCAVVILLISSVEIAVYGDMGYFEREYEKYGVLADVNMEMEDLMQVTEEMMAYLRGSREDLHVPTVVGGEEREFFNEREIAHMEDVRDLFVGALWVRRIALVLLAAGCVFLVLSKARIRKLLSAAFLWTTGVSVAVLGILAAVIASDFDKYFIIFHHIFFDNDLWILDPSTDLLINIVPEGFFADTAARIGGIFGLFMVLLLAVSVVFLVMERKRNRGKALSISGRAD